MAGENILDKNSWNGFGLKIQNMINVLLEVVLKSEVEWYVICSKTGSPYLFFIPKETSNLGTAWSTPTHRRPTHNACPVAPKTCIAAPG